MKTWLGWAKILGALILALLAWSVIGRLLSTDSDFAVASGIVLSVILGSFVLWKAAVWVSSFLDEGVK